LLAEFVRSVWPARSDVRVIHFEEEWPPRLWLALAAHVPASTLAIAVQDGELIVGYRLLPLEIDSSSWMILEGTSYGRLVSNCVRYDDGWKLDDYSAADRTPINERERARLRSRGYRFADE